MNMLIVLKIMILYWLCTIWLNTVIIIQILQEVYGSLGDESYIDKAGNPADVTTGNSLFSKYKSSLFKTLTDADNGVFKNVKIAVPLKYLNNFWKSLEIPLINCKIHLELNWTKNCVISNIAGHNI